LGGKNWRFSQTTMLSIFANASSSLSKKRKFFGENILKIIASVPGCNHRPLSPERP
jgi:hypothetical protein